MRDILSLLAALALPEDDLALAEALRSPLFGLTEDQLFRLAHPRAAHTFLAAELRSRAGEFPAASAMLDDLRAQAEFLRPYEMIERILIRHDGRRRLTSRLGPEALDGIDELLEQALIYEQSDPPSLTGFLGHIRSAETEVKREMAKGDRAIRVMTVHGAKGLEAPVVILPDTAARKREVRDFVLDPRDGPPVPNLRKDLRTGLVAAAHDLALERRAEEEQRLLYVAMTRAQTWLIVAGIEDGEKAVSWRSKVAAGLAAAAVTVEGDIRAGGAGGDEPDGRVRRLSHRDWPPDSGDGASVAPAGDPPLPDWVTARPDPLPPGTPLVLNASDLPGAKTLGGTDTSSGDPRLYGTRLHRLLEHLPDWPRADWPGMAHSLLALGADPSDGLLSADEAKALFEAAVRVLDAPALAELFVPGALAETPVTGRIAALGGRQVQAVVDRMILSPGRILAIDYKSNAVVPQSPDATPDGILRQLAVIADLLAQVFPDRQVDAAILWTASATLMPLSPDMLRSALESTPSLDAGRRGT